MLLWAYSLLVDYSLTSYHSSTPFVSTISSLYDCVIVATEGRDKPRVQ